MPGKDYEFKTKEPKHTGVDFSITDTTKGGKSKGKAEQESSVEDVKVKVESQPENIEIDD